MDLVYLEANLITEHITTVGNSIELILRNTLKYL